MMSDVHHSLNCFCLFASEVSPAPTRYFPTFHTDEFPKLDRPAGHLNSFLNTALPNLQTFHMRDVATGGMHGMGGRPCLLYTSPSPRDLDRSRMPSSA